MSVIPFIDRVKDGSYESLHNPSNYYERQAYAALLTKNAGAILIAGSDAPVDDRDPRPFFNLALGVTQQEQQGEEQKQEQQGEKQGKAEKKAKPKK
jgi:predicted amidohydrolase YtcJ